MGGKPTGCAVASNALMDERAAATNALGCGRPGAPAVRAAGRRVDAPRAWHRADILRMQRGFGSRASGNFDLETRSAGDLP